MSNVLIIKSKEDLKFSSLKRGQIHKLFIHISENALGIPWRVPLIVIRGIKKGPTVGLTAALHGDELNGISTIFKLMEDINPLQLKGNIVLVPITNIPGYLANQRYFLDNVDLNRIMPGKPKGASSQIYAHHFVNKIVSKFDYLLDLHTASHGRVNSLYIRSDIDNEQTRALAYLQKTQIIVNKYDEQGTLRAWANTNNIPSITIEIGNPNVFQHTLIDATLEGIKNTLVYLEMLEGKVKDLVTRDVTVCDSSYWIYSKSGGIVDVLPKLTDTVKKGQVIAIIYNVFGEIRDKVIADKDGIVIGKNIRPNCEAGTRILHLGVDIKKPLPETIPGHKDFDPQ
ncbi:succinylglutamate desuccinylase/aspartoacylase family protein [Pontimicrobium sp. MEBiC06410]